MFGFMWPFNQNISVSNQNKIIMSQNNLMAMTLQFLPDINICHPLLNIWNILLLIYIQLDILTCYKHESKSSHSQNISNFNLIIAHSHFKSRSCWGASLLSQSAYLGPRCRVKKCKLFFEFSVLWQFKTYFLLLLGILQHKNKPVRYILMI